MAKCNKRIIRRRQTDYLGLKAWCFKTPVRGVAPVSYTHLDVYKRQAYDRGVLGLQAPVRIRLDHLRPPADVEAEQFPDGWNQGETWLASTTLGLSLIHI